MLQVKSQGEHGIEKQVWAAPSETPGDGKIKHVFEEIITQVTKEAQKQMELDKIELQKALKEKDQLTTDMNPMDKSVSDLFKELKKQKEVIEVYPENEESLKQWRAANSETF